MNALFNNMSTISEHDIEQRFNTIEQRFNTIEQRLDVIAGIVSPLLDNNSFASLSQGTMHVEELAGGPGPNQQPHNGTLPLLGTTNVELESVNGESVNGENINGSAITLGGKRRKTKKQRKIKKQKKTKKRGNKGKRLTKRNRK